MTTDQHAPPAEVPAATLEAPALAPAPPPAAPVAPQDCGCGGGGGCDCGGQGSATATGFVYVLGTLRAAFPSETVRKEFEEQIARVYPQPTNVPDEQLIFQVLSQGENLYLAREICWVLQVDGVDTYVLGPRTYVELYDLILAIEPTPAADTRYNVIIGPRGPMAGPDMCNGLQLPIVVVNQNYYFTVSEFVTAMAARTGVAPDILKSTFETLLGIADNAGETDEHRALNYLTVRYSGVYTLAAQMLDPADPHTLARVSVRPAGVQGVRRVVEVIFQYLQRATGEPTYRFCKVDVTGQFPFLVARLAPYYPHP